MERWFGDGKGVIAEGKEDLMVIARAAARDEWVAGHIEMCWCMGEG